MHEHVSGIWKGAHREALPENRTVCLSAPETTCDRGETCGFQKNYPSTSVSLVLIWVMHFRSWPSPDWLKCTHSDLGLDIESRCLDPNQS